jgi:hypothetical protein
MHRTTITYPDGSKRDLVAPRLSYVGDPVWMEMHSRPATAEECREELERRHELAEDKT